MSYDYHRGAPDPAQDEDIHNIEAEAALLGGVMLDNRVIDEIALLVTPADFYEPLHARIFQVITDLHQQGKLANPVTLRPYFETDPNIHQVGGPGYFAELTGSGAALIGVRDFAVQIKDLATMRALIAAHREGIERLRSADATIPIHELAAESASTLMAAGERVQSVKFRGAGASMRRVVERQKGFESGISVGAMCKTLPEINGLLGPLAPGQMTIVAGRPGMGKSVTAQTVCIGCALNGDPAILFNLEMSEDAQDLRIAAEVTHMMNEPVDYERIVKGKLTPSDLLTIEEGARRIEKFPFETISPTRSTIEEIESRAAIIAAKYDRLGTPVRVMGFDYIQLISSMKSFDSRSAEISYISGRLLAMFKRLKVHGIVLSQVSREVEKRPDKRPNPSDLKESGRLEEDANNIVFPFREEVYLEKEQPLKGSKNYEATYEDWNQRWQLCRDKVELTAGKVRTGRPHTRTAKFIGSSQLIRSKYWEAPLMGEPGFLADPLAESDE